MNKFFTKNLPWKITSLVLASILWLFVINTQNPMQPEEVRVTSIIIKGLPQLAEKGFVLKNQEEIKNQRFLVRIKGPRLQTDKLKIDNTLISVTLDLSHYMNDLSADSIQNIAKYAVSFGGVEGISVLGMRYDISNIILEKEKTVSTPIQYTITGNNNSEYTALTPIISPNVIEIGGAKSDVERIKQAIIEINIENFSEDELIQTVPVKVYDDQGEEIHGLKKLPQLVEVKLPIGKKKTVPLEATFAGTLPKGYVHTNTIVTPKQITIVGKAELVDAVQKIRLKEIQLNDIIQTSVVKTELILPKGVQYIDNIDNKINVTVEIKKENSYSYTIPTNELNLTVIGMDEGLGYEVLTDSVEMILSATAEELLALTFKDVTARINVVGLTEGEYTLPLELTVPNNFTIVNNPININIRLININEEVAEPEGEIQPEA
ncbi:CdaR family protein [Cellulosilyticum sp. I15G10I2]|uniref:CdaR family protein n=1 Tax=Cellulosilyticum sp. I15G10I2 TaxID=1892843 RepID=UPI00085BDD51|nr:CdaR family protein [Cellulosilyticum sp. I15G10I2]